MTKGNKRFLVYAVALATGISTLPGIAYAETAANATAARTAQEAAAPQGSQEQAASSENPRTAEWIKNRPQEDVIEKYGKEYEGQTIVDTVFDGTTAATESTAKAALTMRTGDMFTVKGMNNDREAIYNTGYFYDLFPTFEKVPEGVVITYHVLENPVLKGVTITGNTVYKTEDLLIANKLVKHSKSNAIVLVKDRQLIGSGVGQTSRVDALKQAIEKAHSFGFDTNGAVMASDAFFPFKDCVEIAFANGIKTVIQPGGSIRDNESVDFCNQSGMAMVMTGFRHFKH